MSDSGSQSISISPYGSPIRSCKSPGVSSPSRIGFSPSKDHDLSMPLICHPCTTRKFDDKEVLRCMFCGGGTCRRCGIEAYKTQDTPALQNIHSSWINESIIAMQRPNEDMFVKSNVLAQFKSNRITAVFNLTEPGEHPFCGTGNQLYSGFPYNPETLMKSGIKHFNYCWQDMTAPSISLMMDIVQVAMNELYKEGRIAVHCHAGYGRTGLAIACILVAMDRYSATEAINTVRQRRHGSIQTKFQAAFVREFEQHWQSITAVFPSDLTADNNVSKSITKSVQDQFYTLSADELPNENLKYLAKIVHLSVGGMQKYIAESPKNEMGVLCIAASGIKLDSNKQAEVASFAVNAQYFDKLFKEVNTNSWTSILIMVAELFDSKQASIISEYIGSKLSPLEMKAEILHSLCRCTYSWFSSRSDTVLNDDLIDQIKIVWDYADGKIEKEIIRRSSGGSDGEGSSQNFEFESVGQLADFVLSSIVQTLDSSLNRMKFFHLSSLVQTLTALRLKAEQSEETGSVQADTVRGSDDINKGGTSSNSNNSNKSITVDNFDSVDLVVLRCCIALSNISKQCPATLEAEPSSISLAFISALQGIVSTCQGVGDTQSLFLDSLVKDKKRPLWLRLASIQVPKLNVAEKASQFDDKIIEKMIVLCKTISLLEYCGWRYVLPARLKINFSSPLNSPF